MILLRNQTENVYCGAENTFRGVVTGFLEEGPSFNESFCICVCVFVFLPFKFLLSSAGLDTPEDAPRKVRLGWNCGPFFFVLSFFSFLHLVNFHDSFMLSSAAWKPTVRDQMICFLFPWGEPHFACVRKQTFLTGPESCLLLWRGFEQDWYKLLTFLDGPPCGHEWHPHRPPAPSARLF